MDTEPGDVTLLLVVTLVAVALAVLATLWALEAGGYGVIRP
jgi:nitrogen fixation-related uncharacterized protein